MSTPSIPVQPSTSSPLQGVVGSNGIVRPQLIRTNINRSKGGGNDHPPLQGVVGSNGIVRPELVRTRSKSKGGKRKSRRHQKTRHHKKRHTSRR
jgi:hypothetical protein